MRGGSGETGSSELTRVHRTRFDPDGSTTMHSTTLKKALVVASVALTLPVLGAGTAYADSGNGHGQSKGNSKGSGTTSAPTSHGTSSRIDPSGASSNPDGTFQGKSRSTPDQDGKGMDRGADNNDKTGPGTDGNNGCGNEPRSAAPRDGGRPTDDDNNGWCGSKPKPAHPASGATRPSRVAEPAVPSAALPATATPVSSTPVTVDPVTPVTAGAGGGAVQADAVAGSAALVQQTPVPAQGSVVAAAATGPTALPFTGAPIGLLVLLGGSAVCAGAALTATGRRRTA